MAENKKSVLLYCDIIHTVEPLTDEEAGKLFKHYLRYINDLNPNAEDRLTSLLFEPIKQSLKRDLKKWEEKSNRNSTIAKEGWKKRKDANAYESKKNNANNADRDNVSVSVNDTVNVTDIFSKENNLSKNFFYIGNQIFKMPLSVWLNENKKITLEAWCQQNEANINEVYAEIDKDVGKMLTDEKHAINFFKSTAKLITEKKNKVKPTQSTNFNQAKDYKL